MPFSIQTKYASKALKQGDVVAIRPDGFKYAQGDCLKEWVRSGKSIDDYKFQFVINYVTDKEMNGTEAEVLALMEAYKFIDDGKGVLIPDPEATIQRKNYLTIPSDYNDPHRINLRNTGETQIKWSELSQYIKSRM